MDKRAILELAKKRGLDVAEEAVEQIGELALDIIGELIKSTENKYDDMVFMAIEGKAREELKKLIDKIDGEEG